MMASSNGNIFHGTGLLWWKFTGHRWIPTQRPLTRCFDVLFDLHLNQQLSKHWGRRLFEKLSRSLWRHCNDGQSDGREPMLTNFQYNFKYNFQTIITNSRLGPRHETSLLWMPANHINKNLTLVRVTAWCGQETSHHPSQGWPRSMPPYGVTRPKLVNKPRATRFRESYQHSRIMSSALQRRIPNL